MDGFISFPHVPEDPVASTQMLFCSMSDTIARRGEECPTSFTKAKRQKHVCRSNRLRLTKQFVNIHTMKHYYLPSCLPLIR